MRVMSESDQRGEVRVEAPRLSMAGMFACCSLSLPLQQLIRCLYTRCNELVGMRRLHDPLPARRVSLHRSLGLVAFALALVDDLLEQKATCRKDQNNRPDFERRLGGGRGGVRGGFVGAGRLAWLAEAGASSRGKGKRAQSAVRSRLAYDQVGEGVGERGKKTWRCWRLDCEARCLSAALSTSAGRDPEAA